MRVLACPDKFRGTATAVEVADAVAAGASGEGWDCVVQPMADGGEGTLEAFGGANRTTAVTGPDGSSVHAEWRLSGKLAVIEMARASGLNLVGGAEFNDAVEATTAGTGELISSAVDCGATRIIVGLGGSATTDGGMGALGAMAPLARYRGVDIEVAADVRTDFIDAAAVFGPQKGASAAQVALLQGRLARLAQVYREEHGVDVADVPRTGAAGGLGGGLFALGANLCDGFELIADSVGLYDQIEQADLVVTGEGRLDATSFEGKVVGGVAELARHAGVPVVAIVGSAADDVSDEIPTVDLTEQFGEERARRDTLRCVESATRDWLSACL
ncbi:MAG: glycerate kinase [Acidimicrobiaceae bacterium]|nr:glycerate kinase [Acidimicrobiaceae bacterium]MDE0606078.1 glycerate kinase [Acidimicrobiaceae bacterium]